MADDPTPDPAPDPTPEPSPEPPAPEVHHECQSQMAGLSDRIDTLEQTLRAALEFKPDSSPVKKPWTHRKLL